MQPVARIPLTLPVPIKSGFGPVTWFQTHNVAYGHLTYRQWTWIMWHYISAFGVMYAVLSWLQESLVLPSSADWQGWKGVTATLTGIALYWLLPHRMVHFHDPIPYSENIKEITKHNKKVAAKANTLNEVKVVTKDLAEQLAKGEDPRKFPFLAGPERVKPGTFPRWFENHNVPYSHLSYRQWTWIGWHYISAFGVMYAVLSWLQDAEAVPSSGEWKGIKGVIACTTGIALYWILPHRMFHFHDPEPCTKVRYRRGGSRSPSPRNNNGAPKTRGGESGTEMIALPAASVATGGTSTDPNREVQFNGSQL